MLRTKKSLQLWLLAGLILSLLALLVVAGGFAGNVLIVNPEEIPDAADAVMNCIQKGDWQSLRELVAGNPDLTPILDEKDSAEAVLWEAYRESLEWYCREPLDTRDNGLVAQNILVTCLDLRAAADAAASLLQENPQKNALTLTAAVEQALEINVPTVTYDVRLSFLRRDGQWLLVPDKALQEILSAFAGR